MRIVGLVFDDSAKHICPICGKEYKSETYLEKHIEKEHPAPVGSSELPPAVSSGAPVTGNEDDEDA